MGIVSIETHAFPNSNVTAFTMSCVQYTLYYYETSLEYIEFKYIWFAHLFWW